MSLDVRFFSLLFILVHMGDGNSTPRWLLVLYHALSVNDEFACISDEELIGSIAHWTTWPSRKSNWMQIEVQVQHGNSWCFIVCKGSRILRHALKFAGIWTTLNIHKDKVCKVGKPDYKSHILYFIYDNIIAKIGQTWQFTDLSSCNGIKNSKTYIQICGNRLNHTKHSPRQSMQSWKT